MVNIFLIVNILVIFENIYQNVSVKKVKMSDDSSECESDTEYSTVSETIDNTTLADKKINIKQIIYAHFSKSALDCKYLCDLFQNNNELCIMRQTEHNVFTICLCILERLHDIKLNEYEEAFYVKKVKKGSAKKLLKVNKKHLPFVNEKNVFGEIVKRRVRGFTFFLKTLYNNHYRDLDIPMFKIDFLLLDRPIVLEFIESLSLSVKRLYLFGVRSKFFDLCLCQSKEEEVFIMLLAIIKALSSDHKLSLVVHFQNDELRKFITEDMKILLRHTLDVYSKKKAIYQKSLNVIDQFMLRTINEQSIS